jgi:hypothetical protein
MTRNPFSFALLVSVFVLLGFIFSAGISGDAVGLGSLPNDSTQVALKIIPIKVPLNIEFATERMPLELPDVKERLDRELLVNTYWHSNSLLMFKQAARVMPVI